MWSLIAIAFLSAISTWVSGYWTLVLSADAKENNKREFILKQLVIATWFFACVTLTSLVLASFIEVGAF